MERCWRHFSIRTKPAADVCSITEDDFATTKEERWTACCVTI